MTDRRYRTGMVGLLFYLLLAVFPAMAADDRVIVTAGPSWDRFTNEDGSGLYHEIIREVFAGFEVKHIYVPTVQANAMVAIGRADIKMCETKEIDPLVLASLPMYENDFFVLFLRKKIEPWRGEQSLEGKILAWREGYYSTEDFPVPVEFVEVRSGESALKMVLLGRADFYVDDLALIRQSFDDAGERFDLEMFGLERVGTRKYYPVFASTSRGEMLRKYYETEMERLYRAGALQNIYERWSFGIPEFAFENTGKQDTGKQSAEASSKP